MGKTKKEVWWLVEFPLLFYPPKLGCAMGRGSNTACVSPRVIFPACGVYDHLPLFLSFAKADSARPCASILLIDSLPDCKPLMCLSSIPAVHAD